MPWTSKQFKQKHFKDATPAEAKIGARVATETLKRHGDDAKAVIAGIMAIKNFRKAKAKKK
jgi:hypothetical protein